MVQSGEAPDDGESESRRASGEVARLRAQLMDRERKCELLREHLERSEKWNRAYAESTSWKLTAPLRALKLVPLMTFRALAALPSAVRDPGGVLRELRENLRVRRQAGVTAQEDWAEITDSDGPDSAMRPHLPRVGFGQWTEGSRKPEVYDIEQLAQNVRMFDQKPLISIVMPVYNTPKEQLVEAIESVQGQIYENWELCIANDASTLSYVKRTLDKFADSDDRIHVIHRSENGHISRASNTALQIARGEFCALMDHDDFLPSHALYFIVEEINKNPEANLLYSDEYTIDGVGRRIGHHFKPDWNEELFLTQNYINHLGVYRTNVLKDIGGFRAGFEGSQDHDMALRFISACGGKGVVHIPRVLYHWRAYAGSGSFSDVRLDKATYARKRAVRDYLAAEGRAGEVIEGRFKLNRVVYDLPRPLPQITIIIPTRDNMDVLKECVTSIEERSTYTNYDVIILDNGSSDPDALKYLSELDSRENFRVISSPGEFNYSALNNLGVSQAKGEFVVLLNNDTEVKEANWLQEMLRYAALPWVGAVGAKLLYSDDSLQHAGVILGFSGIANHSHQLLPDAALGYHGRPHLAQDITAVTGACLMVSKAKYLEAGGLDEVNLKVAYNDIDFCLKLRELGYNNIYTPYAVLYHHESLSRGTDEANKGADAARVQRLNREADFMRSKWGAKIEKDPYYNPNLVQ